MVNEFKLTVVHCMRVDLTLDKKTGKSGLGHWAAGPMGLRADGPSGPRAAGPSGAVGRGPAFSKTRCRRTKRVWSASLGARDCTSSYVHGFLNFFELQF